MFEFHILQGIIERGALFTFAVIGMFLTSRIIKFDDLTIEGSFGIGGAITAWCLLHNIPPIFSILFAAISGGIAGDITGLLHTKLKLNNLISGVVVTAMLFSLGLVITGSTVTIPSTILPQMIAPWIKTAILTITAILRSAFVCFSTVKLGFYYRQ